MYSFDTLPVHPSPEPFESLTSYLVRLAEANNIRYMSDLMAVIFPKRNVYKQGFFRDFPPRSFGDLPKVALCPEAQLQATTFYYLNEKFGMVDCGNRASVFLAESLSPHLRYCPLCLAIQPRPYYSLLWRFKILPGCITHGTRLAEVCSQCRNPIPLCKLRPPLVTCALCCTRLDTSPIQPMTSPEWLRAYGYQIDLEFFLGPECSLHASTAHPTQNINQHPSTLARMRRRAINWEVGRLRRQIEHTVGYQKLTTTHHSFALFCLGAEVLGISLRDLWQQFTHESIPEQRTSAPDLADHWSLRRSIESQQSSHPTPQTEGSSSAAPHELEIFQRVQSAKLLLQSKMQPVTLNSIAVLVQISPKRLRKYAAVRAILRDVLE